MEGLMHMHDDNGLRTSKTLTGNKEHYILGMVLNWQVKQTEQPHCYLVMTKMAMRQV